MSLASQIEELMQKRQNALEKGNAVAAKWKDRESEIPADELEEIRVARDSAIKWKTEADELEAKRKLLNDITDFSRESRGNPDDRKSTKKERIKAPEWARFSSSSAEYHKVRVDPRIILNPRNPQSFFNDDSTDGFIDAMAHFFRKSDARTENEKLYYEANERYSTFRIADSSRGGFFAVPEQMWSGILRTMDDATPTQGLCNVMNVEAETLSVRQRISKARMLNWGSELSSATTNRENTLRVGKRVLKPQYLTGQFLISNDLLTASGFDILNFIQTEIAIDTGEFFEQVYLYGTGANGTPVGLLYNAAVGEGIDASRDVTLGSGTFTEDHLISMLFALKRGYAKNAVWQMHRTNIERLAKLKGSDGHPLWRPSMVAGVPDTLLGRPLVNNEFMNTATSTGTYGILLGDHSTYWILFNGGITMRMLQELYAETNQTAYIYRMRMDAQPMMAEAFVRGKFA